MESLFVSMETEVIEGNGFRVRLHKNGIVSTFYRRHPKKEEKPYQVKDARTFLK